MIMDNMSIMMAMVMMTTMAMAMEGMIIMMIMGMMFTMMNMDIVITNIQLVVTLTTVGDTLITEEWMNK